MSNDNTPQTQPDSDKGGPNQPPQTRVGSGGSDDSRRIVALDSLLDGLPGFILFWQEEVELLEAQTKATRHVIDEAKAFLKAGRESTRAEITKLKAWQRPIKRKAWRADALYEQHHISEQTAKKIDEGIKQLESLLGQISFAIDRLERRKPTD